MTTTILLSALVLSAAGATPPLVAVAPFEGPTASDVRAAALRALSAHESVVRLAPTAELVRAARERGLDIATVEGFEAACDTLRVAAILRGSVTRDGGRWTAQLEVHHRATGKKAASVPFRQANIAALDDTVGRQLWSALGPSLREAEVPERSRRILLISETGPATGRAQLRAAFARSPWLTVIDDPEPAASVPLTPQARARRAREARLDGFVKVELLQRRRRWKGTLTVVGPEGAEERVEAESRRSRPLAEALLKGLGPALDKVQPAPAPPEPPKAAKTTSPTVAEKPRDLPSAPGRVETRRSTGVSDLHAVEIAVSFRLLGRNLSYNDDLFGGLRPYDLAGAPALRLEGRWFPAASITGSPLAWLGVEVEADLAFGLASSNPAGQSFGTSAAGFLAGLRGRIPIGPHRVGISLGGGLDTFGFDDAEDGTDPGIPSVEYAFLRAGLDGRIQIIDALALQLGAGWRQVLSSGELASASWFPNASVAGIDVQVGAGYSLLPGLEIQAEVELRRYFASFDPEPGDFPVAGGAIDQQWSVAVGAAYRF